MYFFIFLIIVLFVIIVIFSFPQFSPIPYFPSNGKDIQIILEALHIRKNQTIIDLGAGDGVVILHAASNAYEKKLNTQFIAVEINPVLLCILHIRRLLHPNRSNIQIINANMFSMDYAPLTTNRQPPYSAIAPRGRPITFYIYISPWFIDKTIVNITRQMKIFELVSYFYQVKCLPNYQEKKEEGIHAVFSYQPPNSF